jgi:hypothetical protein
MPILSSRQLRILCALAVVCAGCGTTRRTDTSRTATEQLLLADAIDRSVSRIDFGLLAGKEVYLDNTYLGAAVDKDYITSTLRQHMLACGCILKDKKDEADLVVEVRAGAVGTDRHDLLFGTPSTSVSLGAFSPVPGAPPAQVPEIALAKRTDQMGVAKIAVFAYERATGVPVWQSGSEVVASKARDLWVFGTGPYQRGSIYGGTKFAGEDLRVPLVGGSNEEQPPVRVARERVLNPQVLTKQREQEGSSGEQVASSATKAEATSSPGTQPSALQARIPAPPPTNLPDIDPAGNTEKPPQDAAVSRSQFDAHWSNPLPHVHGDGTAVADRRWPPAGETH